VVPGHGLSRVGLTEMPGRNVMTHALRATRLIVVTPAIQSSKLIAPEWAPLVQSSDLGDAAGSPLRGS